MKRLFVLSLLLGTGLFLQAQLPAQTLSVDQVHALTDIHQVLPDYMQELDIISFEITLKEFGSNSLIIKTNIGSLIGPDILKMLANATVNDQIWFDDIRWTEKAQVKRTSLSIKLAENED